MTYDIDADATREEIEGIVAQSQKRSAVFDVITNPTNVRVDSRLTPVSPRRRRRTPVQNDHRRRHRRRPGRPGHEPLPHERSIDHVVLERAEVANSWRTERWDSLRLLTPNWMTRLPGWSYRGDDPDGYMTAAEVVDFLDDYRPRHRRTGLRRHHGRRVRHTPHDAASGHDRKRS